MAEQLRFPDTPRLVDIETIAELLGVQVRWVRRQVFERKMPHLKLGAKLRFDVDEVFRWVDRHRRPGEPNSA